MHCAQQFYNSYYFKFNLADLVLFKILYNLKFEWLARPQFSAESFFTNSHFWTESSFSHLCTVDKIQLIKLIFN